MHRSPYKFLSHDGQHASRALLLQKDHLLHHSDYVLVPCIASRAFFSLCSQTQREGKYIGFTRNGRIPTSKSAGSRSFVIPDCNFQAF
ncbi:hypothetical protein SUGI_0641900 [Cryptomeria japonica]|nr:hypothetical protein SUGI_0641900 [Cryptomeria japonica]